MEKNKGFTLIELLAVIVILALLAIVAIPTVAKQLDKSKNGLYETQITNIKDAAEAWGAANLFKLPQEDGECVAITLKQLQDSGYIDDKIVNPKTGDKFDINETFVNIAKKGKKNIYQVSVGGEKCIVVDDTISSIPIDYQEVEYIESTGIQWINTDVQQSSDLNKIELKYIVTSFNGRNYPYVYGAYVNDTTRATYLLYSYNTNYKAQAGVWSTGVTTANYRDFPNIDEEVTVVAEQNRFSVNGTIHNLVATSYDSTNSNDIYLFTRGNVNNIGGSSSNAISVKMYYFKIYKNGVLIRDFVPCYRKSDNVAGMYDTVTKKFYVNSGTGNFIVGPVVNE